MYRHCLLHLLPRARYDEKTLAYLGQRRGHLHWQQLLLRVFLLLKHDSALDLAGLEGVPGAEDDLALVLGEGEEEEGGEWEGEGGGEGGRGLVRGKSRVARGQGGGKGEGTGEGKGAGGGLLAYLRESPEEREERRGRYTGIVEDLGTWISSCAKEEECNFLWMEAAASAGGPATVPLPFSSASNSSSDYNTNNNSNSPNGSNSSVAASGTGKAGGSPGEGGKKNSNSANSTNGNSSGVATSGNGPSGAGLASSGEDRSGFETPRSVGGAEASDASADAGAGGAPGQREGEALEDEACKLTSFDFLRLFEFDVSRPPLGAAEAGDNPDGHTRGEPEGVPGDAPGVHLGLRQRKGGGVAAQAQAAGVPGEEDQDGGAGREGGGGGAGGGGVGRRAGTKSKLQRNDLHDPDDDARGSEGAKDGAQAFGPHGLRLALGDATGAELALLAHFVMRWVGRGAPGLRRLARVLSLLLLPCEDWQTLFLVWFRGAGVGDLLAVDLPLLVDLTRWVGCSIQGANSQGAAALKQRLGGR